MSYKYIITAALWFMNGVGFAQNLPDAPGVRTGAFPLTQATINPTISAPAIRVGNVYAQATTIADTFPAALAVTQNVTSGAIAAGKPPLIDPITADATYWASTSALLATTVINVELTARCSEQRTCLTFIAVGSARPKLYLYTLPTDLLASYVSYRLKRRGHLWMMPQLMLTAANLFSAGRSYGRIQ